MKMCKARFEMWLIFSCLGNAEGLIPAPPYLHNPPPPRPQPMCYASLLRPRSKRGQNVVVMACTRSTGQTPKFLCVNVRLCPVISRDRSETVGLLIGRHRIVPHLSTLLLSHPMPSTYKEREARWCEDIRYVCSMRGLAAALIAAGAVLVCGTSGLLVRIWLVRHSFDMAARSPVLLVCCCATVLAMAILVLLHWFLLLEGSGLPCYVTFWASYACEFPWHVQC